MGDDIAEASPEPDKEMSYKYQTRRNRLELIETDYPHKDPPPSIFVRHRHNTNAMSAQGRPFISMVRHITADSAIDFDSQYDEDDWKHRLVRDGYAVIKVFSDEKAAEYVDKVHEFLEGV